MDGSYTVRGRVERRSYLRQCNRVTASEQKFRSLTPSHLANTLNSRSESIYYRRRYATLERVLAMALCLFACVRVCPSQVGVLSKRIELVFWHGGFFGLSYTVL